MIHIAKSVGLVTKGFSNEKNGYFQFHSQTGIECLYPVRQKQSIMFLDLWEKQSNYCGRVVYWQKNNNFAVKSNRALICFACKSIHSA